MLRVLAIAMLLAGCGEEKACTHMGCAEESARLLLKPPLTMPGTYGIHLVHDGTASDCTAAIPPAQGPACDFEVESDAGGLTGLLLFEPWRNVELTIARDGTKVASATENITYRVSTPNGPGCEPTCYETDSLTVPTTP
jgi:hypothetical protein